MIHLLLLLLTLPALLLLAIPCISLLGPDPLLGLLSVELMPLFLLIVLLTKELSFLTCLSLTLVNLSSLTFSINLLHLCLSFVLVTLDTSSDFHLFMAFLLSFSVAFILLTLSYKSCFSALYIISLALFLNLLLSNLSLILTRIIPLSIHLSVNILWFLYYFILYKYHLSHLWDRVFLTPLVLK